jgi:hypothetical protein
VDDKTAPQNAPQAKLSVRDKTTPQIVYRQEPGTGGVAAPPLESFYEQKSQHKSIEMATNKSLNTWLQPEVAVHIFQNKALALESLGPNQRLKRTGGYRHVIPVGHYGTEPSLCTFYHSLYKGH